MFQVLSYLALTEEDDISWALIQKVLSSVAQTAIIPMQDILGLGSSARMNIPATQVKSVCKAFISLFLQPFCIFCLEQYFLMKKKK